MNINFQWACAWQCKQEADVLLCSWLLNCKIWARKSNGEIWHQGFLKLNETVTVIYCWQHISLRGIQVVTDNHEADENDGVIVFKSWFLPNPDQRKKKQYKSCQTKNCKSLEGFKNPKVAEIILWQTKLSERKPILLGSTWEALASPDVRSTNPEARDKVIWDRRHISHLRLDSNGFRLSP